VAAKYILGALSLVFLGAALLRLSSDGFRVTPASRTWLIVGAVFAAVAGWLWLH
jgi:hypothetical protein